MANAGTAYVNVVPKFPGFSAAIRKEVERINGEAAGRKYGSGFAAGASGGLLKSGAAVGAFSQMTSKAMDVVASSVGAAVSRFDTLNTFPVVMQTLGYSSESAEGSIAKMSDRLQSLPTRLDDMASTVQGIAAVTGDLDVATDAGLALNDMLVASGSSTQLTTAAMEQFRQMLAKGKPEMEDWKSLTAAMPGQMDQLAKAMLGPTANANDLYAALGGGKNDPTHTMDDLLQAMVRLDTEGGAGIVSFRDQAETAAGGVATAASNMKNAVVKGIASIMDEVGAQNIAGAMGDVKGAINDAFGTVAPMVGEAMPAVKELYAGLKEIAPQAATAAAGFAAFRAAGGHIADFAGRAKDAKKKTDLLSMANSLLGTSFSPVGLAVTGVSAALAVLGAGYVKAKAHSDALEKATLGLSDAVGALAGLDDVSADVGAYGSSARDAKPDIDAMLESMGRHVDRMNELRQTAEAEIGSLETARATIEKYAGQTDLSAEAQGRLEWAIRTVNDEFGLSITQADVMAGSYSDADGNARNLTQSINDLIEAKKEEIRVEALSESLAEAYKAQEEAAGEYAKAVVEHNAAVKDAWQANYNLQLQQGKSHEEAAAYADKATEAIRDESKAMQEAKAGLDQADDAVRRLSEDLGAQTDALSESADEWDSWGASASEKSSAFSHMLQANGTSIGELKDDLRSLGASTEDLSRLSAEELEELAVAYDGTAGSAAVALEGLGVDLDEAAAATAEAASGIESALDGFGEGFASSMESAGVDVGELAWKLAEAGVSTETLNAVGSANMAALAEACGGNVSQMVGWLQMYNSEPLVDKDGTVNVDDAMLVDAQGNLYTWNGSYLVDQDGNAAVEDTSVVDAQGHKLVWNGTSLRYQSASGRVYDFMAGGIAQRDAWNSHGLEDWVGSGTINIVRNITETIGSVFKHAEGGIRLHAEGGVSTRAGGAIATQAVPLDIVGEDGAEAIVPLTNRRYSQPFIDLLAEGVAERPSASESSMAAMLSAIAREVAAIRREMPEVPSARQIGRAVRSGL